MDSDQQLVYEERGWPTVYDICDPPQENSDKGDRTRTVVQHGKTKDTVVNTVDAC